MPRQSEEEVVQMKKQPMLIKVGTVAGAIAGIIGLGSQVGPPVLGWVLAGRDARISTIEGKLAVCESKTVGLGELADHAINASERRFQDNEVHAIRIQSSVESLRNEVRIRHNDMPRVAFVSGGRAPGSVPRPTRREALADVKNVSDAHLQEARAHRPEPAKSLRDMITQRVKPNNDPLFGLDDL